jgi:hypothetical protein
MTLFEAVEFLFKAFVDVERKKPKLNESEPPSEHEAFLRERAESIRLGCCYFKAQAVLRRALEEGALSAFAWPGNERSKILDWSQIDPQQRIYLSSVHVPGRHPWAGIRGHILLIDRADFETWAPSCDSQWEAVSVMLSDPAQSERLKSRWPLRDQLTTDVQKETISMDQATQLAAIAGQKFGDELPDRVRFDPLQELEWNIPMALAWIVSKDLDAVREQWDKYRDERAAGAILPNLHDSKPATVSDFLFTLDEAETKNRLEAKHELWRALQKREEGLVAIGTDPKSGKRDEIPGYLWPTLECTGKGRSPEFRSNSSAEQYDHVRVAASKVMKIWPAVQHEAEGRTETKQTIQKHDLDKVTRAYRDERSILKPFPSQESDWKWCQKHYPGLKRSTFFSDVRAAFVPVDAQLPGPRKRAAPAK